MQIAKDSAKGTGQGKAVLAMGEVGHNLDLQRMQQKQQRREKSGPGGYLQSPAQGKDQAGVQAVPEDLLKMPARGI